MRTSATSAPAPPVQRPRRAGARGARRHRRVREARQHQSPLRRRAAGARPRWRRTSRRTCGRPRPRPICRPRRTRAYPPAPPRRPPRRGRGRCVSLRVCGDQGPAPTGPEGKAPAASQRPRTVPSTTATHAAPSRAIQATRPRPSVATSSTALNAELVRSPATTRSRTHPASRRPQPDSRRPQELPSVHRRPPVNDGGAARHAGPAAVNQASAPPRAASRSGKRPGMRA